MFSSDINIKCKSILCIMFSSDINIKMKILLFAQKILIHNVSSSRIGLSSVCSGNSATSSGGYKTINMINE